MIPRASSNALRRSIPLAAAFVAVILAFSAPRYARAIGEPTVTISMDNLALTAGTTSGVVFMFSSAPVGFDNGDVDLSNTHGLLSAVTPSADPRIWNAVFTPNEGVNDDTNTIIVGMQWTDGGGVAPLAPSESANFTVHTASSGGSACPEPSVTLAAPNGGETLDAGQHVDIFWTANGCQVDSLRLALSVDGGDTYGAPFAAVASPFNGYYLWTVPDVDAGAARLRATLIGQGGVVLATDATDGPFAIAPAATTAVTEPAPSPAPPPPATATSTAPAEASPAPPTDTGGTTAGGTPPADASPPTEPAAPASPPSPTVKPRPPAILVSAAPLAASIPIPPQEQIPQPVQPMTNANDNQPLTVERAQGAVEAVSGYVPSPLEMTYAFA
ncbi:MAG TPA: Ig-like domain-containing protein, partial [Patescibacteria group bacterium]|nr:Ig-like domain-containing protein [Patescibacteria group bacterium]